jgi:thiol-disulfide isomerase/thioredoxin
VPTICSGGRLVFLLTAFVLVVAPLQGGAASVDFKAIPKLQEMKERMDAPDFTLLNAGGKKVSLKDFRGKVVFLNFWATWCESCRDEMPSMERLYKDFRGKGLEIVAVNVKEKRQDALAFAKELGGLNKFVHIWPYKSLDERWATRMKSRETGDWPPSAAAKKAGLPAYRLAMQENKIVMPAAFSPIQ